MEVSCGALPETLLESELFGHVKGAFTGAIGDKPGRFLAADGGTIFLDEINSASPAMQVKLLRVLQERAFEPVGSSETKTVDVRVILASNVDLAKLVAEQKFRQDLYYRINVVNIRLPALRERLGDIPLLAGTFSAPISARKAAAKCSDSPKRPWRPCSATIGRATCGNWKMRSSAPWCYAGGRRWTWRILPETLQAVAKAKTVASKPAGEVPDSPMPLEIALEGPERRIIEAAPEAKRLEPPGHRRGTGYQSHDALQKDAESIGWMWGMWAALSLAYNRLHGRNL